MGNEETKIFRPFRDRFCQGMLGTFLRNGCPVEDLFFIQAIESIDPYHFGPPISEGSGLIHQKGLQSSHLFEVSSSFDENSLSGCISNGRHHGCGRPKDQRTGTGDNEDGDRPEGIPCHEKGCESNDENGRDEVSGKAVHHPLGG